MSRLLINGILPTITNSKPKRKATAIYNSTLTQDDKDVEGFDVDDDNIDRHSQGSLPDEEVKSDQNAYGFLR